MHLRALLLCLATMGSAGFGAALAGEPRAEVDPVQGLTPAEVNALGKALEAVAMDLEDLSFPKGGAPCRFVLPATREILADPLRGPGLAERAVAGIANAEPGEALRFLAGLLGKAVVGPEIPNVSVPADRRGWEALWRPVAGPGVESGDVPGELLRLPPPAQEAAARILTLLPAAEKEWRAAFAALSPEEVEGLRQFGPILLIPEDARRVDFVPQDPERANSIRTSHPGKQPLEIVLALAERVDVASLARAGMIMASLAEGIVRISKGVDEAGRKAMAEGPFFRRETRLGRLVLSGFGDDVHGDPAPFLVDFGGNDVYRGQGWGGVSGLAEKPLSLLVDGGGDDAYFSGGAASLGGAILGASAFRDVSGDDVYRGGDCTQGAALFGASTFVDAGGSDDYRGGAFCQGAASFGAALARDVEGRDRYGAGEFAQGFARTGGAACLQDRAGHDAYRAGGRIPFLPLYRNRHFSHAQGFAIGVREHGAAGGIALLLDEGGNDTYAAEVHGQGAACWYGVGMLVDRRGADRYGVTYNGQGSAVHEAAGILLDEGGDDVYTADDGLAQGAAHDLAVGLLLERGGGDRYGCRACGQGVGLNNGVGILVERGGNDAYTALEGHFQGAGRPRRRFGSVGLLVDLAGRDAYASGPAGVPDGARGDGAQWAVGEFGCGLDVGEASGEDPRRDEGWSAGPVPIPEVKLPPDYDFSKEKFRALFRQASLWDVGEDRARVARARGELVAWGPRILPFLEGEMSVWSGLHFWALDAVLSGIAVDHRPKVTAFLLDALNGQDAVARANALRLVGKLKIREGADAVLRFLADPNWRLYAVGPAVRLRLREAEPVLLDALAEGGSTVETIAVLDALSKIAGPSSLAAVTACFSRPAFPERYAAVRSAARFGEAALRPLVRMAESKEAGERIRVHAVQALTRVEGKHKDRACFDQAVPWLADGSWVVRAEAAKLIASFPPAFGPEEVLRKRLEGEAHPFVRGVLRWELAVLRGALPRRPRLRSGIVEYPEYEEE
ncbi:MAG: hypothetical protein ACYS47_12000 [Planctomycetota bacterium]